MTTVVQRLYERLPELEWKLNQLDLNELANQLPKGLFQCKPVTLHACIAEIKVNLHALEQQDTPNAIRYLCMQIEKKINVLVRVCQQSADKATHNGSGVNSVEVLWTRQQQLQALQAEVDSLTKQHEALALSVANAKNHHNPQVFLQLEKELGQATRCLTLAQEKLRSLWG